MHSLRSDAFFSGTSECLFAGFEFGVLGFRGFKVVGSWSHFIMGKERKWRSYPGIRPIELILGANPHFGQFDSKLLEASCGSTHACMHEYIKC